MNSYLDLNCKSLCANIHSLFSQHTPEKIYSWSRARLFFKTNWSTATMLCSYLLSWAKVPTVLQFADLCAKLCGQWRGLRDPGSRNTGGHFLRIRLMPHPGDLTPREITGDRKNRKNVCSNNCSAFPVLTVKESKSLSIFLIKPTWGVRPLNNGTISPGGPRVRDVQLMPDTQDNNNNHSRKTFNLIRAFCHEAFYYGIITLVHTTCVHPV